MTELAKAQTDFRPYVIANKAGMECLEDAGGNLRTAEDSLSERLATDDALREAIIFIGVREAISKVVHEQRRQMSRTVQHSTPNDDNVEGLYRLANQGAREFLDFPLPGGVRLGDADHEKIVAAQEVFRRNARGSYINQVWLGLIDKKLAKGKIVSDQFDQQALLKLKIQADNESDRF